MKVPTFKLKEVEAPWTRWHRQFNDWAARKEAEAAARKAKEAQERAELEACLDETPFGCYLELEGEPQAIRAAMESLGLAPDRAEPRSYPELYAAHGLG